MLFYIILKQKKNSEKRTVWNAIYNNIYFFITLLNNIIVND